MDQRFARDIKKGLSSNPKFIPSKYFYDQEGDRLFQEIMRMEEYYLTDCELEILKANQARLEKLFSTGRPFFHMIEFGAGDGLKTRILLKYLSGAGISFEYNPVDISRSVLRQLEQSFLKEIPGLQMEGVHGEYFEAMDILKEKDGFHKVILFLGSNIGNFTEQESVDFLRALAERMTPGDLMMIGIDLKKDPLVIMNAYNDRKGLTRRFNLNLLARINRELNGDFDLGGFDHYQSYDPVSGVAKSYLISIRKQTVRLKSLDLPVHFDLFEPVQTEISRKYDDGMIKKIAGEGGFEIVEWLMDTKGYFADLIMRVSSSGNHY